MLAVPVVASERTAVVSIGTLRFLFDEVPEEPVFAESCVSGPVCVVLATCATKGSLPAKWLNEKSWDFERFGERSEFGSAVGVAEGVSVAAATVPDGVAVDVAGVAFVLV